MDEKSVVKSAKRVLEVLEYFAEGHTQATVTEMSQRLGYPQSSTSVLLSSLQTLGYLHYDRMTRAYSPTLRVMLLGSWMQNDLFGEGNLVSAMEGLRRRTGQSVMIGLRQGIQVRFILYLIGKNRNTLKFPVGVLRPVCRSPVGKVLLASEGDAEISRIAMHANGEEANPENRVSLPRLLEEITIIRKQGWAETLDYPVQGRGSIAVALSKIEDQPPIGIAIGARKAIIESHRSKFIAALQEVCQSLEESREHHRLLQND